MNKISVIMPIGLKDPFFELGLQSWYKNTDYKLCEFVVVQDNAENDQEILNTMRKFPFEYNYIRVNQKLSDIEVYHNPALLTNIGVKNATHDIILHTNPHVFHLKDTARMALKYYNENEIVFGSVWISNEKFIKELDRGTYKVDEPQGIINDRDKIVRKIRVSEEKPKPYYYAGIFSKQKFIEIGGVNEEFARGFKIEDEEISYRFKKNGINWKFTNDILVIHPFHGEPWKNWNWDIYWKLYEYFKKTRKDPNFLIANQDRDWGSDKIILEKIRIEQ